MRSLPEYLEEEFTMVKKQDALLILERYQLSTIIEKLIFLLKDNPDQPLDIAVISSSLVIGINDHIGTAENNQRQKIESLFTDLVFVIFIDFLKGRPSAYSIILQEIKRHTFTTCNLMGYDFNVFKKLIDTYAFNAVHTALGNGFEITDQPVEMPESKITWTGKGRLEELVYQLKKRKLIKSKTSFFDLFLKPHAGHITVKWDFERKGHLAHLLCELYKKGLIAVTLNRGYFSYAEKHFTGFDGTVLKANSLKKLSSAIHTKSHHYQKVIADITEIIDKVTAMH